jgi:hypothetical protein
MLASYPASLIFSTSKTVTYLSFANSEHFGAAVGAYTLSCRFAILHANLLGIFHFPLGTTLHAICLHSYPPLSLLGLVARINYSLPVVNSREG